MIPVRNEERDLGPGVRRLHAFLREDLPFAARITIADNASDDGTWPRALVLETELDGVRAVRLERPGRGGALRSVWSRSDAAVLAYLDVGLSAALNALLPLLAPLLSGHSDVAVGTRLARGARMVRGRRREVMSRCYNLLLHASLGTGFSDAQCGFKAIRADAARVLLPLTKDTGWFFDTELLVLAERAGLRIAEVAVDWVDDADSRVQLVATALAGLRGIVRLVSQLARFMVVGVASTAAYVVLFLLLRGVIGAQGANAVSLLVTAVANTAVNRRVTFGIRGRAQAGRHQARGPIAFGTGLAFTSGALTVLHHASARPGRATEVSVLIAANLLATIVRFALYRSWVFRGSAHRGRRAADLSESAQDGPGAVGPVHQPRLPDPSA